MTEQNQSQDTEFFELSDQMLSGGGTAVPFHSFKTGQHKFRLLPPFAPNKLFHQADLHWGFTDQNGKKRAIHCTKFTFKTCPICDMVDNLKKQKVLHEQAGNLEQAQACDKQAGEIRRKPTYLWNIMFGEEQKVLQLSWNGHDPLLKKVQFYWNEKRINITSPKQNYMIFLTREGQAAKTRYTYEVLDNTIKQIEVPKLFDLSKIYPIKSVEELNQILTSGQVHVSPTDKPAMTSDFYANAQSGMAAEKDVDMPKTQTPPQPQAQTAPQAAQQPPAGASVTAPPQVSAPAAQSPVTQAAPQPQVGLNQSQDAEIQKMLAALNG